MLIHFSGASAGQAQCAIIRLVLGKLHEGTHREGIFSGRWPSFPHGQSGAALCRKFGGPTGTASSTDIRPGFKSGRVCLEPYEDQWGVKKTIKEKRVLASSREKRLVEDKSSPWIST